MNLRHRISAFFLTNATFLGMGNLNTVLASSILADAGDTPMEHHSPAPEARDTHPMHRNEMQPEAERPHGDHDDHHHGTLEISNAASVPSLDLAIHDDPVSGWNLQLITENFRFAPEQVNGTSSANEGHAHLYINGEKITRLYGNWYHLPQLEPGMNEITVTLNTNRHEALTYEGDPIADSIMISVP